MARVLIIDPDKNYCESLTLALSQHGHEVRTAASASQGIAIAQEFHPVLLITEWAIGCGRAGCVCWGDEVAERLRSSEPRLRTIVMTGRPDAADDEHLPMRCDRIVTKPFHIEQMLEAMRHVLGRSEGTENWCV